MPPPFTDQAWASATWSVNFATEKKLGMVSWQPADSATNVDVLVIGDSYADDVDMGFFCWPSCLARSRSWSVLNTSRGGATTGDAGGQYDRAITFAKEHQLTIADAVCIVHLGGNNLLQLLWLGPLALILLMVDVMWFTFAHLGLISPSQAHPRISFFGLTSQQVADDLAAIVHRLAANGHKRILVSGLPLCSCVPTARVVVGLLAWPLALVPGRAFHSRTVSFLIDEAARMMQATILSRLQRQIEVENLVQSTGSSSLRVRVHFFDEAAAIRMLAMEAQAAPASLTFWRDAHHPTAHVHARLAEEAANHIGKGAARAAGGIAVISGRRRRSRSPNRRGSG